MSEIEGATPAEEVVKEVIAEEVPKSMDDTIRETLRSLKDKGVEIPEETKTEKVRDEKGKFAEKPPVVGENTEVPVEKPAPNTWRKEVQAEWGKLPPSVRDEVERREADFHKGIEQYKSKAQMAEAFEKAMSPYQATIQSLGISPDKAISELMAADHRLRYGSPAEKQAYFSQLARSYNIDLGQQAQTNQQAIDPNIAYFQQKLQAVESQLQQQTMMGQQKEQESLNSEITQFSTDPSHSHFESVKLDMAGLLQAGLAKDLQDAYEQAIWRNPTTRQALIAEQQTKLKEEATQKAQAAKQAASVNVKTRPAMPTSTPVGSMDDTIRATYRKLTAA